MARNAGKVKGSEGAVYRTFTVCPVGHFVTSGTGKSGKLTSNLVNLMNVTATRTCDHLLTRLGIFPNQVLVFAGKLEPVRFHQFFDFVVSVFHFGFGFGLWLRGLPPSILI